MNRPLVSVIVPVYNMGRYLADALNSVFGQDYDRIELIVVDDGSTDDSALVARAFGAVRYIHQPHEGVAAARNTGIGRSHGELVAFLDADDVWAPNKLTVQVGWLMTHPEAGYVAAHFRNFLDLDVSRPAWITPQQLVDAQQGGLSNLVARRSVFEQIGLFNTSHHNGSDLDWTMRATDARIAAAILPDVLFSRRIHETNLSHQWRGGKALLLQAIKASIDRRRARQSE